MTKNQPHEAFKRKEVEVFEFLTGQIVDLVKSHDTLKKTQHGTMASIMLLFNSIEFLGYWWNLYEGKYSITDGRYQTKQIFNEWVSKFLLNSKNLSFKQLSERFKTPKNLWTIRNFLIHAMCLPENWCAHEGFDKNLISLLEKEGAIFFDIRILRDSIGNSLDPFKDFLILEMKNHPQKYEQGIGRMYDYYSKYGRKIVS